MKLSKHFIVASGIASLAIIGIIKYANQYTDVYDATNDTIASAALIKSATAFSTESNISLYQALPVSLHEMVTTIANMTPESEITYRSNCSMLRAVQGIGKTSMIAAHLKKDLSASFLTHQAMKRAQAVANERGCVQAPQESINAPLKLDREKVLSL